MVFIVLTLDRKELERIKIGDDLTITILDIKIDKVSFVIDAPNRTLDIVNEEEKSYRRRNVKIRKSKRRRKKAHLWNIF